MKFKELTKAELKKINDLFQTYLFYETLPSGDRQFYCTHCNRSFLQSTAKRKRLWTSRDSIRMNLQHNDFGAECPLCKTLGKIKNIGKCKKRINLYQANKVAVIHKVNDNCVQIRAYYCSKNFQYDLMPNVYLYERARYILTPGKAERYLAISEWSNGGFSKKFKKSRDIGEPFTAGMFGDLEYSIIGVNVLRQTFLKYNMLEEYYQKHNCYGASYLCRFAQYPNMEMLQKLGHYEVVDKLVIGGRKSQPYVNWKANKPWDFFKMNKQQYNEFVKSGAALETLKFTKLWEKDSGKYDLTVGHKIEKEFRLSYSYEELRKSAIACGISIYEAVKYILKGNKEWMYRDYLMLASNLEYDLTVHNVAFPKNLKVAHDDAAAAHKIQLEEQRKAEQAAQEQSAKATLDRYDKKYSFEDGEFVIIVPHTIDEIIQEGRQQKHCVAGYASRHMNGKLAILFLRSRKEISKSLYTIEMHEKSCIQIQGYNNRTPLTDAAGAFYREWIEWVKAGSRRRKDGTPIFKKVIGGISA